MWCIHIVYTSAFRLFNTYAFFRVIIYYMNALYNQYLPLEPRECHNHSPKTTPDTKRKRKKTKIKAWNMNKQMHEKYINHLALPKTR